MRHIPNVLTVSRILFSLILLFVRPMSGIFYLVYLLCGISDMADGVVARKTGNVSKTGAALDSAADCVFIACALIALLPAMEFSAWMLWWIAAAAVLRFASLLVCIFRFHVPAFLHTRANKLAGLILFCFPFLCFAFGMVAAVCVSGIAASLSAVEEFFIMLTTDSLERDRKPLFVRQSA